MEFTYPYCNPPYLHLLHAHITPPNHTPPPPHHYCIIATGLYTCGWFSVLDQLPASLCHIDRTCFLVAVPFRSAQKRYAACYCHRLYTVVFYHPFLFAATCHGWRRNCRLCPVILPVPPPLPVTTAVPVPTLCWNDRFLLPLFAVLNTLLPFFCLPVLRGSCRRLNIGISWNTVCQRILVSACYCTGHTRFLLTGTHYHRGRRLFRSFEHYYRPAANLLVLLEPFVLIVDSFPCYPLRFTS